MRQKPDHVHRHRAYFAQGAWAYVDDDIKRFFDREAICLLVIAIPSGVIGAMLIENHRWIGFVAGYGIGAYVGWIAGMIWGLMKGRDAK